MSARFGRGMAGAPAAAALALLSLLPSLAVANRYQLALDQEASADFHPDKSGDDAELKKADSEDCAAAMLKCAGTKSGGEFTVKKGKSLGPVAPASLLEEVAAFHESLAANVTESLEEVLSIELATLRSRFNDFECDDEEMSRFRAKFGLHSGSTSHANFGNEGICKENNVVWLYPAHDHNGAFAINENVCHRLLMWSEHACSVNVRRISSIAEAQEYLSRFQDGSIMHLVMGGHGNGYALQWGEKSDGWFGLEGRRGSSKLHVGSVVQASRTVTTMNVDYTVVQPGDRGYVGNVDPDGDAIVHFDKAGMAYISWSKFKEGGGLQEVDSILPMTIIGEISKKMQQHGSIFTDSCLSASGKWNPNLASWVARNVGKGVRVIGSEVSFGKVNVKRFTGGWHASLHTSEMRHAQRIFVNHEAKCPKWAKSLSPDHDGNCVCNVKCRTKSGEKCPSARGEESETHFLPFCGESWAEDPCQCLDSSGELDTFRAPEVDTVTTAPWGYGGHSTTPGSLASAAGPSLILVGLGFLSAVLSSN